MFRLFALGALLSFLTMPGISKAAPSDGPTIMLRVQSVDKLLDNAEYLAILVGQEEAAKQFLGFIKALANEKGIEGVDNKRAFVAYANLKEDVTKSDVVLMLPIADQESFLGLLKTRLGLEVKDEKNGLYSTEAPNNMGTVYLRFANKYVYGTLANKDNVDEKKLPKPEDVTGKGDAVIALGVRLDRIPPEMKKFALGFLEDKLAEARDAPIPDETPAIKKVKITAVESFANGLKGLLEDGEEITLQIDIDKSKDEIGLQVGLTGKKGSTLAKEIADFKLKKSVSLGALPKGNAAVIGAINLALPDSIKKVIAPAIDELADKGLMMAPNDARDLITPIIKAALPTFKAGEIDLAGVLLGPDAENHFTLVTSGKVVGGKDLEKAIKDAVAKAPAEVKDVIEIDADTVGDFKLHRLKVSDKLDEKALAVVGKSDVWLTFRDDSLMMAFGPKAKESLKEAVKAPAVGGPVALLDISVARIATLVEKGDLQGADKIAKDVFGKDLRGDTITVTVEGGESFHFRLAAKGKTLKFFALIDKLKKGN